MKNKVTRNNQLNRTKKVNNKDVILNLYYLLKKSTLSFKCQITLNLVRLLVYMRIITH